MLLCAGAVALRGQCRAARLRWGDRDGGAVWLRVMVVEMEAMEPLAFRWEGTANVPVSVYLEDGKGADFNALVRGQFRVDGIGTSFDAVALPVPQSWMVSGIPLRIHDVMKHLHHSPDPSKVTLVLIQNIAQGPMTQELHENVTLRLSWNQEKPEPILAYEHGGTLHMEPLDIQCQFPPRPEKSSLLFAEINMLQQERDPFGMSALNVLESQSSLHTVHIHDASFLEYDVHIHGPENHALDRVPHHFAGHPETYSSEWKYPNWPEQHVNTVLLEVSEEVRPTDGFDSKVERAMEALLRHQNIYDVSGMSPLSSGQKPQRIRPATETTPRSATSASEAPTSSAQSDNKNKQGTKNTKTKTSRASVEQKRASMSSIGDLISVATSSLGMKPKGEMGGVGNDPSGSLSKGASSLGFCDVTNPMGPTLCPYPIPLLAMINIMIKCLGPQIMAPAIDALSPEIMNGEKTPITIAQSILLELQAQVPLSTSGMSIYTEHPHVSPALLRRMMKRSARQAIDKEWAPLIQEEVRSRVAMSLEQALAESFLELQKPKRSKSSGKKKKQNKPKGSNMAPMLSDAFMEGLTPTLTEGLFSSLEVHLAKSIALPAHEFFVSNLEPYLFREVGQYEIATIPKAVAIPTGHLVIDLLVQQLPLTQLEELTKQITLSMTRSGTHAISESLLFLLTRGGSTDQLYSCSQCYDSGLLCDRCIASEQEWQNVALYYGYRFASFFSDHYGAAFAWRPDLYAKP